ncbi:MAG: hypothetical protein H5T97_01165 [Firmicutes bacterium]|nr:hypothetical protein [Bacillota bacterium]
MPNFKIFQDNPDRARIKIFGNQDVALNTDLSGNLGITSTGLAVTAPAGGLLVTAPAEGLAVTPPTGGLLITSTGLAVTAPAGGLLVTSTGLNVLTNLTTADISEQVATNDTAGLPGTSREVLGYRTWSFGVVNASTTIAPATVKLQISPDGTNWIDEGGPVTLNTGDVSALVSSIFLKYARIYYAAVNAASTVTLNIFFQAQT